MVEKNEKFIDEGVIKFTLDWTKCHLLQDEDLTDLIYHRNKMAEHNLIGTYPQGVGFGNISQRQGSSKNFYISGSQTGHHKMANDEHFSLVSKYSITENSLSCQGHSKASSESLTHAMFYELSPDIKSVVHVHHQRLWKHFLHKLPTTSKEVPYGTTAMAKEIHHLFQKGPLQESKVLVMGGHEDGLISYGSSLTSACKLLIKLLNDLMI